MFEKDDSNIVLVMLEMELWDTNTIHQHHAFADNDNPSANKLRYLPFTLF